MKPIPSMPGYSASDEGYVFNPRGDILGWLDGKGYLRLKSGGKNLSVHRCVAEAFFGPCPSGMQVNHKNGVKTDNRPENLEYVTCSDNVKHAYETGLLSNTGERNPKAKLTEEHVLRIRASNLPQHELAVQFGVSYKTISHIIRRRRWAHV